MSNLGLLNLNLYDLGEAIVCAAKVATCERNHQAWIFRCNPGVMPKMAPAHYRVSNRPAMYEGERFEGRWFRYTKDTVNGYIPLKYTGRYVKHSPKVGRIVDVMTTVNEPEKAD